MPWVNNLNKRCLKIVRLRKNLKMQASLEAKFKLKRNRVSLVAQIILQVFLGIRLVRNLVSMDFLSLAKQKRKLLKLHQKRILKSNPAYLARRNKAYLGNLRKAFLDKHRVVYLGQRLQRQNQTSRDNKNKAFLLQSRTVRKGKHKVAYLERKHKVACLERKHKVACLEHKHPRFQKLTELKGHLALVLK